MVTNTINYGYDDDARHLIEIDAVLQDGKVIVTLRDDARAFDPTQIAEPDIDADLDERPIGGLGIHLARAMMDDINYRHIDGRNQITLTKIVGG